MQQPENDQLVRKLPVRRREANPLRLALLITLITTIALGFVYVRVHRHRSALLDTQQACLDFKAPADRIVYEENSQRAAELLSGSKEYVPIVTGDSGEPIAGRIPAEWKAMLTWVSPKLAQPQDAVLFLHERQTQLDKRGLICVQADRAGRKLRVTFVHPGASTLDPVAITDVRVIPRPQEGLVFFAAGDGPLAAKLPPAGSNARVELRFFSGQIDPADSSHWILPYELENYTGELEMWVVDERTVHYLDRRFAK